MRALGAGARLLAAHPVVGLGLGLALVLSLGAVCCGLGLVAAPWLVCELLAWLLGTALGRRIPRQLGWLGAGLVQAVAVVVVSAAAGAAVTWLGAQLTLSTEPPSPVARDNVQVLGLALGGSVVALLYMTPFLYTPTLLVDRGGVPGGAFVESARLVMRGGLAAHLLLSVVSHLLQLSPVLIAAGVALLAADPAAVPLAVAIALPVMALSVPLGQAMIVSSYVERRPADVALPPFEPPVKRSLAFGLGGVAIAPALALLLVSAAVIARPSHPRPGTAPLGELVVAGAIEPGQQQVLAIPTTALTVHASARRLAIVAGDGGGAGRVPRPPGATFDRVRVVRVRDAYAIEVGADDRSWVTWIDRAGVRLDDDLAVRLADHLPPWGLPLLALAMVAVALGLASPLARLSEGAGEADRRRAWRAVGWLAPLAVAALAVGLAALWR